MKIAIAGFGLEGRVNYDYFANKYPEAEVVIVDERGGIKDLPDGAKVLFGQGSFDRLGDFDLVVRTPSLRPDKITTSGEIWSATNEFFQESPAPIIGVTGTKGKGTTCSIIENILQASGIKTHLVGNIGRPALEVLPIIQSTDIVIYELSSFQLFDLQKSPHIAVVTMIEPDHLDVHLDFEEYLIAKSNITVYQTETDVAFYVYGNQYSEQIASRGRGQVISYGNTVDKVGVYVENNQFKLGEEVICETSKLALPGVHNLENACAAISVAKYLGINNASIEKGIILSKGLPHRLSFVAEVNGVKYYDDSIATTPGSAISAIKSFSQPKVLILGGHDKGADYRGLAEQISQTDSVRAVLLVGANAEELAKLLAGANVSVEVNIVGKRSMPDIVNLASTYAHVGDVVILSPAAASFDMFESYQDRGDQFIKAIERLSGGAEK